METAGAMEVAPSIATITYRRSMVPTGGVKSIAPEHLHEGKEADVAVEAGDTGEEPSISLSVCLSVSVSLSLCSVPPPLHLSPAVSSQFLSLPLACSLFPGVCLYVSVSRCVSRCVSTCVQVCVRARPRERAYQTTQRLKTHRYTGSDRDSDADANTDTHNRQTQTQTLTRIWTRTRTRTRT